MLAKYVPSDIKYIFTKFYRHISTNNEANHKFVILISNCFKGCDVLTNLNNTAPSIGIFARWGKCSDQRERNTTTGLFGLPAGV